MTLEGKNAFVTGGSRGIGKAIVTALVAEGCRVTFTYRSAEAEANELVALNPNLLTAFQHDAVDFAKSKEVVAAAIEKMNGLDFLVNNAGMLANKPLTIMNEQDWDSVIDTNLKSVFNLSRCVVPHLMRRRSGRIVNIASVGGLRGLVGQTNYCASKGGAIAFTAALAKELARGNITVNSVAPGFIETDMTKTIPESYRNDVLKNIPAGRFGKAEEVAGAVLFLVSPAAQYITGQTLVVDWRVELLNPPRRVVVTGVAPICSLGVGKDEVWRNFRTGKTNLQSHTQILRGEDVSLIPCKSFPISRSVLFA